MSMASDMDDAREYWLNDAMKALEPLVPVGQYGVRFTDRTWLLWDTKREGPDWKVTGHRPDPARIERPVENTAAAERFASLYATTTPATPPTGEQVWRNIAEAYDALVKNGTYQRDPHIATPAQRAAHEAATDLPQPRWCVVSGLWFDREEHTTERDRGWVPRSTDPYGSLFGRSLLRTGRFVARPTMVNDPSGWDVGEHLSVI